MTMVLIFYATYINALSVYILCHTSCYFVCLFIYFFLESGDIKASIAVLSFILSSAAKHDVDSESLSSELQQLGLPKGKDICFINFFEVILKTQHIYMSIYRAHHRLV